MVEFRFGGDGEFSPEFTVHEETEVGVFGGCVGIFAGGDAVSSGDVASTQEEQIVQPDQSNLASGSANTDVQNRAVAFRILQILPSPVVLVALVVLVLHPAQ